MTIKCMILVAGYKEPTPSYKDLDALSPTGGKVIYGGGKRKNKTNPYLNKLTVLESTCSSLYDYLDKDNVDFNKCEAYLFEDKAALSLIKLKYQDFYSFSFMFDDMVADELFHINWSLDHIRREITSLEESILGLNFFKEKNISDEQLERSFPAYEKVLNEFSENLQIRSQNLIGRASEILNAGWGECNRNGKIVC